MMKGNLRLRLTAVLIIFCVLLSTTLFTIPVPAADTLIKTNNDLAQKTPLSVVEPGPINFQLNQPSIRDKNQNKISDFLDTKLESGCAELDVILMYNREILSEDIFQLNNLGIQIGTVFDQADMISLQSVPAKQIKIIANLPGVERVENHGTPVLYSDIATPAVKARESDLYSPFTAWELGYTGEGANIAVVDTGADNAHPGLAGKWVGGVDLSKPETPLINPYDGSKDADDTNGHGTTCSGIAMGTGAPEGTYMGAAPDAKLVDVRIGTMIGYAPGELLQSYYDASLKGIEWVMDHQEDSWQGQGEENQGIDIISLSWGIDVGGDSDGSDPYSRILDRAVESGVIVSHAAGNSGPDNTGFDGFAAASNGISVAAIDDKNTLTRQDDIIATYSSRGPRHDNGDSNPYNELKPDVAAPGTNIVQVQFDIIGDGAGNGYGNRGSGTSYAAPVVAGICALMLDANPDLTPELTKEILHHTSERRGEPTIPELDPFWNRDFGWGEVDAYKAVKLASELGNIGAYDVNLQCFITNITPLPTLGNTSSGEITIEGLAFAKEGEVESIEISIDNGNWKTIRNSEEDGIYLMWEYKLDTTKYKNGNYSIKVRATGSGGQSLEHSVEIIVQNKPGGDGGGISEGFTTSIVIVLILGVAVLAYIYHQKRKARAKSDEKSE
jgi:serine protease AprX